MACGVVFGQNNERQQFIKPIHSLFVGLPAGITWAWNQRIQEQGEQGQQMALNFLLALFLVQFVRFVNREDAEGIGERSPKTA